MTDSYYTPWKMAIFWQTTTPLRQLAARLPIGIPICDSKLQTASVYPPNVAPPSRRNGPTPVGTDLKTSPAAVCVRIPPEALWRKHGWGRFLIGPPKWKAWNLLFCHLCHLIRLNIVLFNAFFFANNLTSCLTCIEGKNLVVKPLQHNEGMPLRVSNYTTNLIATELLFGPCSKMEGAKQLCPSRHSKGPFLPSSAMESAGSAVWITSRMLLGWPQKRWQLVNF